MKREYQRGSTAVAWLLVLFVLNLPTYAQEAGGRRDHPAEALKFRRLKLQNENGEIPPNAWMKAIAHKKQMRVDPKVWPMSRQAGSRLGSSDGLPEFEAASIQRSGWTWHGPGNIGGRVRSLLIHSTTPSTMWVGGVSGGVWKTLDAGASWFPLDDFMPNLAISCMALDPVNPDILYAGTGERFGAANGVQGAGIFKTTDGGTSWTQLPSTTSPQFYFVNRLAISPANSLVLLAATSSGIFRSTDGGTTWIQRTNRNTLDLVFDPGDGNKCLASGFGFVSFSTDGGLTWTDSTGIAGAGRIEIAYAPSSPGIVYASVDKNSGEVFRSVDGGTSFTLRNTGTQYLGNQGNYDNCLWVDPTNPNTVIVGGIDLWRSTDGGTSFIQISDWRQAPTFSAHADHHVIVNPPNFNGTTVRTLFFGTDGGVYRAGDPYAVGAFIGWTELNNNLGITQMYGVAGHAASGQIVAGTQDNGTLHRAAGDGTEGWTEVWGGDGGFCAFDPVDPGIYYGEYVNLQINRSGVLHYISGGITDSGNGTTANFIAPFILDPNNPNTMLAGGRSLWRSTNVKTLFPGWTNIKPATSNLISAIAVARGNSDIIWVGHNNGDIFATANGTTASPTWTRRDLGAPNLPGRFCTRIAIDPADPNLVYATFGGFSSNNVWRTTDAGLTWTDISGNLPDAPVNSLVIDPNISSRLYIGTDVGVFGSADSGVSWSPNNEGPANVAVSELVWIGKLVAATNGRGCFSITPSIWVDFTLPCFSCGDGSFGNPFNTLHRARQYVSPGGTIHFKAGSSGYCSEPDCLCAPERDCFPVTFTEAVNLEAFNGPVTIGR
jgi:photosystem II stability/assembly factor-like uncharacterized protein